MAWAFASAVVALSFVNTLFSVRISYAQRDFSTAMSGKDVGGWVTECSQGIYGGGQRA